MVRAPRLSYDSTFFDNINSVVGGVAGPTIADAMWLDSEPTCKAHLAKCLAHMYKYQEERGAPPLPDFDEFLAALARPRWSWTPQASTLFRRIRRIILDFRRTSPVRVALRAQLMQRRRAALWRRYGNRQIAIGREASEAARSVVND